MANKFDDLLKAVNDRYKGKYMALASDTSAFAMERLPTGILAVDAITYGGLPKGRIIIFWGEWSAAKTFTALKTVARTQRTCRKCATFMADKSTETTLIDQSTGEILLTGSDATSFIEKFSRLEKLDEKKHADVELTEDEATEWRGLKIWHGKSTMKDRTFRISDERGLVCPKCGGNEGLTVVWAALEDFDPSFAKMAGVDLSALMIVRSEYAEQTIDISAEIIRSGKCDLMVIDSVAMMTPAKEIEESAEKQQQGLAARLINKALRRWTSGQTVVDIESESGTKPTLILINQVREKIGVFYGDPSVMPGGKGQTFANSLVLRFRGGKYTKNEDTSETVNRLVHVKVEKSKVCVDENSQIFVSTRSEFVKISDVKVGEAVFALQSATESRIASSPVSHVTPVGQKRGLTVKLQGGHEITCSADHEFLMWRRRWVPASKLKPGMFVGIPRSIPIPRGADVSLDRAALIGYLLGDGYVGGKTSISLINTDHEIVEDFSRCVKSAFGYSVVPRDKSGTGLEWAITRSYGPGNLVRAWLREIGMFGCRAWEKVVPSCMFGASREAVGTMLACYLATDGWVTFERNHPYVGFSSVSKTLLDGVRLLLLGEGIVSTIKFRERDDRRDSWELEISNLPDVAKLAKLITYRKTSKPRILSDAMRGVAAADLCPPKTGLSEQIPPEAIDDVRRELRAREISAKMIGDSRCRRGYPSLAKLLGQVASGPLKRWNIEQALALRASSDAVDFLQSSIAWVKVLSVDDAGYRTMYDLSVPNSENYVVNGVITHNCPPHEEGEFVVWLRHYEDNAAGSTSEPKVVLEVALKEGVIERGKTTYTFDGATYKSQKELLAVLASDEMVLDRARSAILSKMNERRLRHA